MPKDDGLEKERFRTRPTFSAAAPYNPFTPGENVRRRRPGYPLTPYPYFGFDPYEDDIKNEHYERFETLLLSDAPMTTYNLTRWVDKPTSGRFVYRGSGGTWVWQCDMCYDYETGFKRWSDAVSHALDHAYLCPHVNAQNRSYQPQP